MHFKEQRNRIVSVDPTILAFTLAALLVTVTPGPDTFLVIMNTLKSGLRTGLATVVGIASGGLFHAALFAFGVAQVLVYSPAIFMVVKLLGAGYLVWLGVGALWSAIGPRGSAVDDAAVTSSDVAGPYPQPSPARGVPLAGREGAKIAGSLRSAYVQGVITNALNPKVAVFYLAFLPQFMQPTDPIAAKSVLLIGIHYAMGLVWLSLVALFVMQFNTWLRKSMVQRVLEGTVGAIMTFFGVKLALATR
jgi:threonine/homoserine/homoserine lactone efflux protein